MDPDGAESDRFRGMRTLTSPSDDDNDFGSGNQNDVGPHTWTRVGVLVRVTGSDPKGLKADGRPFFSMEAGKTTLSASGFLCPCRAVPEGWAVVTSAMILAPFMKLHEQTQDPLEELMPTCIVEILLENGHWMRCELVNIARSKIVLQAADRLVNGPPRSQRGIDVSCVALLRVPSLPNPPMEISLAPTKLYEESSRGSAVVVVSSPFGLVSPSVFQNSLTTGIISNVVRWPVNSQHPTLYLTDARCLPGSEGGAVLNAKGRLVGMIAPSFQRMDQTNLELGAILPWHSFAQPLGLAPIEGSALEKSQEAGICAQETTGHAFSNPWVSHQFPEAGGMPLEQSMTDSLAIHGGPSFSPSTLKTVESAVDHSAASVVLICVNTSWGSGILISEEGYILSCAHLFRPYTNVNPNTKRLQMRHRRTKIRVTLRDDERRIECEAQLLFCSQGPIDIALLKIVNLDSDLRLDSVPLLPESAPLPRPGDKCVAIGHAIFDPSTQLQATTSAGVLARIVPHPHRSWEPAIFQTCACVFRGHSGGLLADDQGRFIGILTSNARHSNGNIIPEINFSIPINMIRPLLGCINKHASIQAAIFDSYDRPDPTLLSLWRLEASVGLPASTPEPSVPVEKGSRFSDFLAQLQQQQDQQSKL